MAQLILPMDVNQYHNQQTTIIREKHSRKYQTKSTEPYRFSFVVDEGELSIHLQKGTGRKQAIAKESQVQALTIPVMHDLLLFMKFDVSHFQHMKQKPLVEFICGFLSIPTKASLQIYDSKILNLLCKQNIILQSSKICELLTEYISTYCSNFSIICTIILRIEDQNLMFIRYVKYVYDQCSINFSKHANDQWKYEMNYSQINDNDNTKKYQNDIRQCLQRILNEYNKKNKKNIKIHTFWYSLNRCIFRYFNWNMKQFAINDHIQKIESKQDRSMTEQKKCAIHKFFGSAFNALWNIFSGNNYNPDTSNSLLLIVKLCLLSYNSSNDATQSNISYFDTPLRLRLQNRGRMKLISNFFYQNVAIKLYDHITEEINKNLIYYDQKKLQDIAKKIKLNENISKAFHNYIRKQATINVSIQPKHEEKVLRELTHRICTRYLRSVIKRNNDKNTHVGQHRTRIKSLYTQ